jgi:hypothetical protein
MKHDEIKVRGGWIEIETRNGLEFVITVANYGSCSDVDISLAELEKLHDMLGKVLDK